MKGSKNKKPKWVWVALVFIVVSAFTPQILSAVYPLTGCWLTITTFEKQELLSFYGAFLSFLGTVALGGLALWQNQELRKLQERQMHQEQTRDKAIFVMNPPQFSIAEQVDDLGYAYTYALSFSEQYIEIPLINKGTETAYSVNHSCVADQTGEFSQLADIPIINNALIQIGDTLSNRIEFSLLLSTEERTVKRKACKQFNVFYKNSCNILFKQNIRIDIMVYPESQSCIIEIFKPSSPIIVQEDTPND